MKNNYLTKKILASTMAVTIFFTGYGLGKRNSKTVPTLSPDEYALNYDTEDNELEPEIIEMKNEYELEKNESNEGFDASQLIVMEGSNINDEASIYILNPIGEDHSTYEEYHGLFGMRYGIDPINCNIYYYKYVDSNTFQPLTNYLTEGEMARIANKNGKITSFELDVVLARIRKAKQAAIANDMFELIKSENKIPSLK